MAKPGKKGIERLVLASAYSWAGLRAAYAHEEAIRQEALLSLLLIPLSLWLGDNGVERALLLGSWLLVPLMELLNSAIEAAVDRIGEEHHELSGRAKDIGSAVVLVALLNAVVVWWLVLTG